VRNSATDSTNRKDARSSVANALHGIAKGLMRTLFIADRFFHAVSLYVDDLNA
jgi:hypothetical protein